MSTTIRRMIHSDIQDFYQGFQKQGWDKPIAILERYLNEQTDGARYVFVATYENQVAGYATLLPCDPHGAFANQNIPTIFLMEVEFGFKTKLLHHILLVTMMMILYYILANNYSIKPTISNCGFNCEA